MRKRITVITPCFNEELNVEDCAVGVREVFERDLPEYELEHLFCDNASSDGTVAVLRRLAEEDPRIRVIVNARNFGPFRSTFNALMSSTGDGVVVLLAADLQDPPAVVVDFVRRWEEGFEVVYGVRTNREEGIVMRTVRRLYYRLVRRVANVDIPLDAAEFQFVDRKVVEALRVCDDYYPYIRGMIANCGFRSTGVPYTWKARAKGISKNRLYHLLDQGLNGLISFTNIPMRACMLAGFLIASLSLTFALFSTVISLMYFRKLAAPGIPTLIVALFFFSGVQLMFLGILGEYISAIHFQVRKRPMVVERERINFPGAEAPEEEAVMAARGS